MFALKTIVHAGVPTSCMEVDGGHCYALAGLQGLPATVAEVFADWDGNLPRLRAVAAAVSGLGRALDADSLIALFKRTEPLLHTSKKGLQEIEWVLWGQLAS